jgi:pimeloyl-ACP methyl ester carboxylesterase
MSRTLLRVVSAVLGCALSIAASPATGAGDQESARYCQRFDAYELGGCGARHRLPATPLGRQLQWVLAQVAGDADSLTEAEVLSHVDGEMLQFFPADQIIAAFQQTLAELGPATFVGFSYPPRREQGVALVDTKEFRAAIATGVSPRTGLLDEISFTEAPPMIVPSGPYSGWFDVGGRQMFLRCTGHGSPTVVFENGLTTDWYALQNRLAHSTRVCSYDTPLQNGAFSRSDPAPTPRTGSDRVRELRALLAAAHVPGPYILAGHSNGGLFSVLYASRHPNQVAGLVLIDGVHPGYHRREVAMLKSHLPPATWRQVAAHNCDIPPPFFDSEQMDICRGEAQTRAALRAHPLRLMPLAVLSHGLVTPGTYPPGWPGRAVEHLWSVLQNELAALEPGSDHLVATRSDHDIPREQPALVVAETLKVVQAVRDGHKTLNPLPK